MLQNLKVTCIGSGYVGGPTMAVLADKCPGIKVFHFNENFAQEFRSMFMTITKT